MGKLGSKATSMTTFPGQFSVREGTFEAELLGAQIYWNDSFKKDDPDELQLGFILGIEDDEANHDPDEDTGLYIHREQFVRLQIDDEGNFSPGGARAKAYKLISAFYGQDFDAFDEEFEWSLEAKEFDDMDSIEEIPHRKDYDKNDEWMKLTAISVLGQSLFGSKALIQFGNAQKPDGSYSDRVSIVGAMALPRKRRGKGKSASSEGDSAPRPARASASSGSGSSDSPAHVKWVLARLAKAGVVDAEALAFLAFFSEAPLTDVNDFPMKLSKAFKGLWEADNGEQITEMVKDWQDAERAKAGDPPEDEEDEDEFEDDDEFEDEPPKKTGKVGKITKGKTPKGQPRQPSDEDEFPPEEDLPF